MSYTALYRKFRPDTFSDVKGQEHIVTTLKNQIKTERIGHAYLFCGTRGTGKTTVAKILAKTVNCENPIDGEPCNTCAMCKSIQAGTSLNVIEIDAASNNGVDNIREINEEVSFRPAQGKYKVYIIDEAHMLTSGAFNALLKTLEEPPSYAIFILATTEVQAIAITIRSRCQRYDFRRIPIEIITDRLKELLKKEGVESEEKALRYIAKAADGSLRDALSLLDQCIAFYLGKKLTFDSVLEVLGTVDAEVFGEIFRLTCAQNVAGIVKALERMVLQGREMGQFVTDYIWYLRNMLMIKSDPDEDDVIDLTEEDRLQLLEDSSRIDHDTLMRHIRILSDLSNNLRYATQKRVMVEIAFMKMCRPSMETDMDAILDRLRTLETKMGEGMPIKQVAAPEIANADAKQKPTDAGNKQPEKAAPEDLQEVRRQWKIITGQANGRLKVLLDTAEPKYNGQTGEPKLYIAFTNRIAEAYLNHSQSGEDAKLRLQQIIEERIGKTVEIEFVMQDFGNNEDLADIRIDDILKDNIQIEIETEE